MRDYTDTSWSAVCQGSAPVLELLPRSLGGPGQTRAQSEVAHVGWIRHGGRGGDVHHVKLCALLAAFRQLGGEGERIFRRFREVHADDDPFRRMNPLLHGVHGDLLSTKRPPQVWPWCEGLASSSMCGARRLRPTTRPSNAAAPLRSSKRFAASS